MEGEEVSRARAHWTRATRLYAHQVITLACAFADGEVWGEEKEGA